MTFEQKLQEIAAMPTATLINRLENEYLFECEGGGIANCAEWVELKARLRNFETCGVIQLSIHNPNLSSYMDHWEHRAITAEEEVTKLKKRNTFLITEVQKMGPLALDLIAARAEITTLQRRLNSSASLPTSSASSR